MNILSDMLINLGVTALFVSIKNEQSKGKFKKICIKIVTTIKSAFAGDPDFEGL